MLEKKTLNNKKMFITLYNYKHAKLYNYKIQIMSTIK